MRSIVEDFRRGPPPPGAPLPKVNVVGAGRVIDGDDVKRGTTGQNSGWVQAPALPQDPPGWSAVDRLLDADDRAWREDRRRQFELAKLRAEAERREIAELQEKLAPKDQK
jgi:hypothetical protein